jgi:hypothetical protein
MHTHDIHGAGGGLNGSGRLRARVHVCLYVCVCIYVMYIFLHLCVYHMFALVCDACVYAFVYVRASSACLHVLLPCIPAHTHIQHTQFFFFFFF